MNTNTNTNNAVHLGAGFEVEMGIELRRDLLVGSKLYEVAKAGGEFNISSDFLQAVSEKVHIMVLNAQHRAKQRGAKTLKSGDI